MTTPDTVQQLLAQMTAQTQTTATLATQVKDLPALPLNGHSSNPHLLQQCLEDAQRLASDPRLPDHFKPFAELLLEALPHFLTDEQTAVAQRAYSELLTAFQAAPSQTAQSSRGRSSTPHRGFVWLDGKLLYISKAGIEHDTANPPPGSANGVRARTGPP